MRFRYGLLFVVIAWLVVVAALFWPSPKDDTDPPDGRSGMRPHTDYKTGCQYLSAPGGGLTNRLDAEGRHMGCAR